MGSGAEAELPHSNGFRVRWDTPSEPSPTFQWTKGTRVVPTLEMDDLDEWARVRGPGDVVAWYPRPLLARTSEGLETTTPYGDGTFSARRGDQVQVLFGVDGGWVYALGERGHGWMQVEDLEDGSVVRPSWLRRISRWAGLAFAMLLTAFITLLGVLLVIFGLAGGDERWQLLLTLGTLCLFTVYLLAQAIWNATRGRARPLSPHIARVLAILAALFSGFSAWVYVSGEELRPLVGTIAYGAAAALIWRAAGRRSEWHRGRLAPPPYTLEREYQESVSRKS